MSLMDRLDHILVEVSEGQIVAFTIVIIVLMGGLTWNGYSHSQKQAEVKCLSCLALSPEVEGFDGWWVDFPDDHLTRAGEPIEHPSWVLDTLDNNEVVIVFLWTPTCTFCKEQWAEMVDYGLVQGEKENGELARFQDKAQLLSLDASGGIGYDAYMLYSDGQNVATPGVPDTIFITELANGDIGWYCYVGKMAPEDVESVINIAFYS